MSYHIYTTKAVILKKTDLGEADRLYSFFTKNFGRLEIKARGARYLKSKLRYHLSGVSVLRIVFVETTGGFFRLIDAEEIKTFAKIRANYRKTQSLASIFSLLLRLIQGQQQDEAVWDALISALDFLENQEMGKEGLANFETSVSMRILNCLGYGIGEAGAIQEALGYSQL